MLRVAHFVLVLFVGVSGGFAAVEEKIVLFIMICVLSFMFYAVSLVEAIHDNTKAIKERNGKP